MVSGRSVRELYEDDHEAFLAAVEVVEAYVMVLPVLIAQSLHVERFHRPVRWPGQCAPDPRASSRAFRGPAEVPVRRS